MQSDMLRQKAKDQVIAENLCGPKTLRSKLVGDGNSGSKVDLDDLETCELIGQGAFGLVHKVQEKTSGQCRVMKTVMRPEGWDDKKLKMEAELLRNLDHPHILRIFSWYEDGDAINIVMEHCEGGELLKVVRKGRRDGLEVTEKWLATAVRQSLEALVYLHSKGVVHKDLKGNNILLLHNATSDDRSYFETMPHVVICDLGIAEVCCRGIFGMRGKKVAGTPVTMAPEVWKGSCSPKSDVWSMGCVTFELFANRLPFEVLGGINKASKVQEKWLELHRRGPDWKLMDCSPQALSFCKQLLVFKEAARPSASECLRHAWFNLCEECRLSPKEVSSICEAVLTWRERNPMQRALCLKMAVGCTCISKFAKIFTRFDTDHSGILERAEIIAALQGIGIDRANAKKAAAALDVNGDNSCEYLEFVAACLSSLEEQFDELLRQEFRALDKRGRGELTVKELEPLLQQLRELADAHGLQLHNIDKNGDGVISFTEFCEYFGRKGVDYVLDNMESKVTMKRPAALPMKEHIRIMNNSLSVEDSVDQIRRSMERSGGQKTPPAVSEGLLKAKTTGKRPSRSSSKDSRGGSERAIVSRKPSSEAQGSEKSPEKSSVKDSPSRTEKDSVDRAGSQGIARQCSNGSGLAQEESPQGTDKVKPKGKPRPSKDSQGGSERTSLTRKTSSEAQGAEQSPEKASAKDSPSRAEKDAEAGGQAKAAPKRPARRRASGSRPRKEAVWSNEPSEVSAKPDASDLASESTKPHLSEGDTADNGSAHANAAQQEGLPHDGEGGRPAAPAPWEALEGRPPAPAEDVANSEAADEGRDPAPGQVPRLPPHPCDFKLSSDNINLITTSFVQSPVTSFEKMESAPCTAGCLPMAGLPWLRYHLPDDGVSGLSRGGKPVKVYAREPLPAGHCIVSL